jgi:hypothetical protein
MPDIPGELNFPSNSKRRRPEKPEDDDSEKELPARKIQKIISGEIVKKKKTIFNKMGEMFLGDDAGNVGSFVLYDVLIPSLKSTVVEMIKTGAEMLFFGEVKGSRTSRDSNRSRVSYGDYFKNDRERRDSRDTRDRVINNRSGRLLYDFRSIEVENRGESEKVLSALVDLIDEYGEASVTDFYDALGMSSEYVDNRWGWTNLTNATIERTRGGWYFNLPNPIQLD